MNNNNFTSYAQNFEDIILWRALKHIKNGFYVDIGAQDPRQDSVSRGFYEKGWRGVHFEPTAEYARKLRADRPDEPVYEVALSDQDGEITFYVSSDAGVSTGLKSQSEINRQNGFSVNPKIIPTKRLVTLSSDFKEKVVHWMKIDVEGMEEYVLKGWDSSILRPWILVIEATLPNSRIENCASWDYLVQEANYKFVYFDGLNRFYVAREREDVMASFTAPVNIFDGIEGCRISPTNLFISDYVAENNNKITSLNEKISSLQNSFSWRLTQPIRYIKSIFNRKSLKILKRKSSTNPRKNEILASAPIAKVTNNIGGDKASKIISFENNWKPDLYLQERRSDPLKLKYPNSKIESQQDILFSGFCISEQLESMAFRHWISALGLDWRHHRKLWEFGFVVQALYERGCLKPGKKGLGFAVGEEPLPALFASMGCEIMATDLDSSDERSEVWAKTAQLASDLSKLRRSTICPDTLFNNKVSFRPVDMNKIPEDLKNYDFTWSTCSFEHCGSIRLGIEFIENQLNCLRSGGIAVHTTEFNLSSLEDTIEEGPTVLFRKNDVEEMIERIKRSGHYVEPLCTYLGEADIDRTIDMMPYSEKKHLKLFLFEKYISTSIALIIRKK